LEKELKNVNFLKRKREKAKKPRNLKGILRKIRKNILEKFPRKKKMGILHP